MLNHLSLGVSDLARSSRFYDAIFEALGYVCVDRSSSSVGYGQAGSEEDQIRLFSAETVAARTLPKFHIAFSAPTIQSVGVFHRAALREGGQDAGAPAYRRNYGPEYYAAFVLDPDGYKLEAKYEPFAGLA